MNKKELLGSSVDLLAALPTPAKYQFVADERVREVLRRKETLAELNERFRPRWYGIITDVQRALGRDGL